MRDLIYKPDFRIGSRRNQFLDVYEPQGYNNTRETYHRYPTLSNARESILSCVYLPVNLPENLEFPTSRSGRINYQRKLRQVPDKVAHGARIDPKDDFSVTHKQRGESPHLNNPLLDPDSLVPKILLEKNKIGIPYRVPIHPAERISLGSDYSKYTVFIPKTAENR